MRASSLHIVWTFLCAALLGAGPLAASARAQIQPLPVPRADSSFGVAVALSDGGSDGSGSSSTRALVGASGENACGANSGAAYVFEKDERGAWVQAARLVPSDCEARAFFGRSLALSGDRALVGASKEFFADERPNVAYIFERDPATGRWNEAARLTVNPQRGEGTFAASVALEGNRALVTSRGRLPSARSGEAGAQAGGESAGGAAYVFERDASSGRWRRVARLTPDAPDPRRAFGGTGVLDGDRLAVTASPFFTDAPGAVYVFERRGPDADAHWEQTARLEGFTDFDIPLALDGPRLLVGESRAGDDREGAAVLFERTDNGAWEQVARLAPRTPYRDGAFGTSVSLSGERALVTGYDEQLGLDFNIDRVVYVFERRGNGSRARWVQRQILDVGDVAFGATIDHYGTQALVGHVPEGGPGAAYVIGLR